MDDGMRYAVRHASFQYNTCHECIGRHGEIIPTERIFAGDWDHPHGQCYWTYHKTKAAAILEAGEMLTIEEINRIYAAVDEAAEALIG
jgi:hypothetical protein